MSDGPAGVPDAPGVYLIGADGLAHTVHVYQGGDYGPEEIAEHFGLGRVTAAGEDDPIRIELSARELRELRTSAAAYSFDFAEPFIEMCLEMARAGLAAGCDPCRFVGNF